MIVRRIFGNIVLIQNINQLGEGRGNPNTLFVLYSLHSLAKYFFDNEGQILSSLSFRNFIQIHEHGHKGSLTVTGHERNQLVLNGLDTAPNLFLQSALGDAGVLLYVTDTVETADKNEFFLERVRGVKCPVLLLINKVDLTTQDKLVELVERWHKELPQAEIIPISALNNFNVQPLKKRIESLIPPSPPYFEKDALTDRPARFFVTEIIREKVLLYYKKEIPYSVEVVVESFKEEDERIHIQALIVVERDSQKGIIIGHRGVAIKKVGTMARRDMERFFEKKIFLELFVKVEKDWRNRDKILRAYGYRLD